MQKLRIGVLGANGFIGSKIVDQLKDLCEVISITRDNYENLINSEFDVFINCNGNGRRYLSEKDPKWDFEANCTSTYKTLFDFKFKQYIHLSTLDVFKSGFYGSNKKIAENILIQLQKKLKYDLIILRLGMVVGKDKTKGIVYDILNNIPLSVTSNTTVQIITATEVAKLVFCLLNNKKRRVIMNVAGFPAIKVSDIVNITQKRVIYKSDTVKYRYNYKVNKSQFPFKTSKQYLLESLNE